MRTHYFELRCGKCGRIIGYHCGHPCGYVECPECKEESEGDTNEQA